MEGLDALFPPISDGAKVIFSGIGTALAAFVVAWRGYRKGQPTGAATAAAAAAIEAATPVPMTCRAGELQARQMEIINTIARIEEEMEQSINRQNDRIADLRDVVIEIRTQTRPHS